MKNKISNIIASLALTASLIALYVAVNSLIHSIDSIDLAEQNRINQERIVSLMETIVDEDIERFNDL